MKLSEEREEASYGTAENCLLSICTLWLRLFASATFAYHFSLALQLPVHFFAVPFVAIFIVLTIGFGMPWRLTQPQGRHDLQFLLATSVFGCVIGVFVLLASRPDADDIQLFHRSLFQLQHLDQPFITTEPLYGIEQIPIAFAALLPSYEVVLALGAHLFGLDPLQVFHNLAPFCWSILWVFLCVLLYRQFRLSRPHALAATGIAVIFLIIDGNLHRSFGNMTLVRLWQGKVILWTLCLPLIFLLSYRYLRKPSRSRWGEVFLALVAAQGLSATGLFLAPALVVALSFAYLFTVGVSSQRWQAVAVLNVASVYNVAILTLMAVDLFPNYDLLTLFASWPQNWTGNVGLVVSGFYEGVRNLLCLLVVPIVCLPKIYGRFFVFFTLAVIGLYINPWAGEWLMPWVTAGAYWRFLYLLPLPLCAGFAVERFSWNSTSLGQRLGRLSFLGLLLTSVVLAYHHSVLTGVRLKAPAEYRFPSDDYAFSQSILDRIDGKHLLAPETIVHILPLLKPSLTIEAARSFQTVRDFTKLGQADEGKRRVIAQDLVTTCTRTPQADAALLHSIQHGVNALIVGHCQQEAFSNLQTLLQRSGTWIVQERLHSYVLLLREDHF